MNIIAHGTLEQKIDLFFMAYDSDGNGLLSFEEAEQLCRLQISSVTESDIVDELSKSFATLIFKLAGIRNY